MILYSLGLRHVKLSDLTVLPIKIYIGIYTYFIGKYFTNGLMNRNNSLEKIS